MHQKGTAGLCHENNQLTEADLKGKRKKKREEYKVNRRKTRLGGFCFVLPSRTGSSVAFQTGCQNLGPIALQP